MSEHPKNLYVSNEDYEWLLDYLADDEERPYLEDSFGDFLNNIRLTGEDMRLGSLPSKDGLAGSFISQAAEGFAVAHGQELSCAIPEYLGHDEVWSCDAGKIFDKYLDELQISRDTLDSLRAKDEHIQQMESLLVDAFEVYQKARGGDEDNINPPYSVEEVKDVYRGDVSVALLDEAYGVDHPRNLWVEQHDAYAGDILRFDGNEFCGLYANELFIAPNEEDKAEVFGIHSGIDYQNEGEIVYYAEPLDNKAECDAIFSIVDRYLDQGIGDLSKEQREHFSQLVSDARHEYQPRDRVDTSMLSVNDNDYLLDKDTFDDIPWS